MKIVSINKIKESRHFPFIYKLLIFIVTLLFLDYSIGKILEYFYKRQQSGLLYRATYSIDSAKADILIFGSSRANHHYGPIIFENRLHHSCYNTGRDGQTIFYNYAVLKGVLKRYSPRMIILDFSREEFLKNQESYDKLSALLPYYKAHPEMRSIIELKSPFEKYKLLLSKTYPYNSLIFTIAIGTTELNKSREEGIDKNGYVPLTEISKKPISTDSAYENFLLDYTKINYYESFINDCMNANVKLYIALSPVFIKYTFKDPSVEIARGIAKKFNIPFYDFSKDSLFLNNAGLFADAVHLNDKGAKIFSNKVIDHILQDQSQNPVNSDNDSLNNY